MSAPATMPGVPATPKPRPYRRYLTSALHRRFVHSVLLAFANALLISFWTGTDYFWSWFPIGPAGFKAALFMMSSLVIFVLQLATMNVGRRTSTSPLQTIRTILFKFSNCQIVFWYVVSAWWFCETYIWAVPAGQQMGWVIGGDHSTLDRLNERPIYLRFFFTVIALVQSAVHLYYGHSFLHIPVTRTPTPSENHGTHSMDSAQIQLQKKLPIIGMHSLLISALATVITPFIYKAFFRSLFWQVHLYLAKLFLNLPRSDAHPPDVLFIGTILGSAFFVGAALSFLWEMASHSFMIFLKQEPLKNGLPLSAGSKDPNGTLLNGLVSKRSVVKTFAQWELAIIAQKFPDRRRAIFADFERPNGPMWTSMLKTTLSVLSDVDGRILATNSSPAVTVQPQETQQIIGLPRIAKETSHQRAVAPYPTPSSRAQQVREFLTKTAPRELGQSTNPWSPPIKETQQKLLEYSKPVVEAGQSELRKGVNDVMKVDLISALAGSSSAKKISGVVLGNPVGSAAVIVDATEAVTKMLVASLNEDNFGKAVQTVPESVKQFTTTITLIEAYVSANAGALTADDEKELDEVDIVVNRLKAGLRELLAAFHVFLNDTGLGIKDLNEARRASDERDLIPKRQPAPRPADKPEMEQRSNQRSRQQQQIPSDPHKRPEDAQKDARDRRAQETAQSLRRIEAQPRRQRISGTEGNVFGARDFSSMRSREIGAVR